MYPYFSTFYVAIVTNYIFILVYPIYISNYCFMHSCLKSYEKQKEELQGKNIILLVFIFAYEPTFIRVLYFFI